MSAQIVSTTITPTILQIVSVVLKMALLKAFYVISTEWIRKAKMRIFSVMPLHRNRGHSDYVTIICARACSSVIRIR